MKKIIKRMLLIVIIICVLALVSETYLTANMFGITREYDSILDDYIEEEELMLNTSRMMYQVQSLAASYIVYTDTDKVQEYGREIDLLKEQILQSLDKLGDGSVNKETDGVYHTVYSGFISYMSHEQMARNLVLSGSSNTAQYYVNNIMEQKLEDINKSLNEAYRVVDEHISSVKSHMRWYKAVIWITSAIIVTGMVAGIVMLLISFRKSSTQIVETYDNEIVRHNMEMISMQRRTIEGMAELVESRDGSTGGHVKRTAVYVTMLARKLREMGYYTDVLTDAYIDALGRLAPLHDVGKIVVKDAVLLKPGKYESWEFDEMKEHTLAGERIITNILGGTEDDKDLLMATQIAVAHHERWDGAGYPKGLSGEDIPLCARIMAVADVYDALVSVRCYKEAFPYEKACAIIEESAGSHLDPKVVEAFCELKEEFLYILRRNLRESD